MKKTVKTLTLSFATMILALPTTGNAAIWAPTGDNSIFFTFEALLGQPTTDRFGIFEDTADIQAGALPVLSFASGSNIHFTAHGSDFDIGNGTLNATLLGSNRFKIGWLAPGNSWMIESASSANALLGNSVWQLTFDPDLNTADDEMRLYAIGVTQTPVPVPVPAAIGLFISGLLGLFGMRFQNLKHET